MKKVKIGVLGGFRGNAMIQYCKIVSNAELVAICDKSPEVISRQKENTKGLDISFYTDYDEFLNHEMDAVVLANYATQHAPFAIKALKKGKHVFSEILPCQNLAEAVELVEAVEESGKVYSYGENCCYFPAVRKMKELYQEGKIGEFEYGEGEYLHNCEPMWPMITYGEENHWRNTMYANFYCTHSTGPIIYVTGLRPVSVIGIEGGMCERKLRSGAKGGQFGMEIITLENGGIIKSIHGDLYENSLWFSMYGGKGRVECAREDEYAGVTSKVYLKCDEYSGEYPHYTKRPVVTYMPEIEGLASKFGHVGGDFYTMYNFTRKILGDEKAEIIDVYQALDMFLPGLLGYRSVLNGNKPIKIPNFRKKEEREAYRHDIACVDELVAKEQVIPSFSKGNPNIPKEVYERQKRLREERLKNSDIPY
ncbi:MAG: Gfo/Idh/MocA family oxidoreductase [Clostridia bacterium]|nr:Gfo/Idh/MocA family oxidoreductase [Clostridia bacterium]